MVSAIRSSAIQPSLEAITSGNSTNKSRCPQPIVVAGILIPEPEVWRWFLRIKKRDDSEPFDKRRIMFAEVVINNFVRPRGFRFVSWGEGLEADGYILVTQSKWFKKGYSGMPDELVPHYPAETKAETRGRNFLEWQKVEGAQELEFRSMLLGANAALF